MQSADLTAYLKLVTIKKNCLGETWFDITNSIWKKYELMIEKQISKPIHKTTDSNYITI